MGRWYVICWEQLALNRKKKQPIHLSWFSHPGTNYCSSLLYRVFSLTWPASMQIYWNKRKRLHKKGIQLTGLGHQRGRRFIVLGHQHGRREVMWKHSIAWENSRHLATPSLVSPRNDVWGTSAEIPYWWRLTLKPDIAIYIFSIC